MMMTPKIPYPINRSQLPNNVVKNDISSIRHQYIKELLNSDKLEHQTSNISA
jgi:hypothetical protein